MASAVNGRILNVDLTTGDIRVGELDEGIHRRYIGGYGIGARLLFDHVPAGADPLGPDNVLGFLPGLLSGTPLFGSRFQVVCKSPLTGGWGDANCGGDFGPVLKCAGWDGVLFFGVASKPLYLYIEDTRAELRDASDLWGQDCYVTEATLKERHGRRASVACIGQAGERLSLISGIVNERGRLAARSGVGAVMGSKNLKAIACLSSRALIMGDDRNVRALRRASLDEFFKPIADFFRSTGTPGVTSLSTHSGDAPIKNWGGVGTTDFPDVSTLTPQEVLRRTDKRYGCWQCPTACGGEMTESEKPDRFAYPRHVHRPEYETMVAFGPLNLNGDLDSLIMANHLCNLYGFDTISAGCTISFAIECFENGIIAREDTDGIELRWGNSEAIVAMLDKMGRREGFGDLLADGVRRAARRLGRGAQQFAMEVGGQELPMHDPKLQPHYTIAYLTDATPGRHTQYVPHRNAPIPSTVVDRKEASGRAAHHKAASAYMHIVNCAGLCMFTMLAANTGRIPQWLNAVTGWDTTWDELLVTGERISTLRMAFTVREGVNPALWELPGRVIGRPPFGEGPHRGFTLDVETMREEYLEAVGWNPRTLAPTRQKLLELGLADVANVLHGDAGR